jgi:hypothetical protein
MPGEKSSRISVQSSFVSNVGVLCNMLSYHITQTLSSGISETEKYIRL